MASFASIILKKAQEVQKSDSNAEDKVFDAITFIEAKWGLAFNLYPIQRIIIKAHYGIPLDENSLGLDLTQPVPVDTPNYDEIVDHEGYYKYRVPVSDWTRKDIQYMTEAEYLQDLYDRGQSNINTVVEGHERREMILALGRRSGKCVRGDTLVLTDRGIYPIEDLGDKDGPEFQPLDLVVAQEGVEKRARSAYFYNGGVKDTIRVRSRCGYEIEGTANHRIKVLAENGEIEWRYLGEIKESDVLCIHRATNLWSKNYVDVGNLITENAAYYPKVLDEQWGLLLGYLTGDGTWNSKYSVELTLGDLEAWEHGRSLMHKVFGCGIVKEYRDARRPSTGTLRVHRRHLRKFLHKLGFVIGVGSDEKRVPWVIMKSPSSVVSSFLRGLFETDGGVESGGKTISFSTASHTMAKQVQILLLNFGVVSRIAPKVIQRKTYWTLTVRGLNSRRIFYEKIGFVSSRKNQPLYESLSASREGGDAESIPYQKQKAIISATKNAKHKKQYGNIIKASSKDNLTYARIAKLSKLGIRDFDHFHVLQYFFDPISSITQHRCHVYDLNVPQNHEFVANGFTNHNTQISACIAAYEIYKLIKKGCPQEYYGIPPSDIIKILSVATDKDQAKILYSKVQGYFKQCDFFIPYTANNTQSYAKFQTPYDIQTYGKHADNPQAAYPATLETTFKSCVAKGLRGISAIVVILDEVAHFVDTGQSSADEIYSAIRPAQATFSKKDLKSKQPLKDKNGKQIQEERMILISSPLGKQGLFYELFQKALQGGSETDNMLAIQAPSWEVNPTIASDFLQSEFKKDAKTFFVEFGAEFSDRTRGWIENATDLLRCIDPSRRPVMRAPARLPHYAGLDVALVGDMTAIAIGHVDNQKKIVVDQVDSIQAGVGKYADQERLEFEDVVDWIYDYTKKFYIVKGLFDQHLWHALEDHFKKRGLSQFEGGRIKPIDRTEMFNNFKSRMYDQGIVLYDWPKPEDEEHCEYIQELLELQATQKSKYILEVEAPNILGKHDDRSDALIRMVWLASQHVSSGKYLSNPLNSVGGIAGMNPALMQRHRMAMTQGGSHPQRMVKRTSSRRWTLGKF